MGRASPWHGDHRLGGGRAAQPPAPSSRRSLPRRRSPARPTPWPSAIAAGPVEGVARIAAGDDHTAWAHADLWDTIAAAARSGACTPGECQPTSRRQTPSRLASAPPTTTATPRWAPPRAAQPPLARPRPGCQRARRLAAMRDLQAGCRRPSWAQPSPPTTLRHRGARPACPAAGAARPTRPSVSRPVPPRPWGRRPPARRRLAAVTPAWLLSHSPPAHRLPPPRPGPRRRRGIRCQRCTRAAARGRWPALWRSLCRGAPAAAQQPPGPGRRCRARRGPPGARTAGPRRSRRHRQRRCGAGGPPRRLGRHLCRWRRARAHQPRRTRGSRSPRFGSAGRGGGLPALRRMGALVQGGGLRGRRCPRLVVGCRAGPRR